MIKNWKINSFISIGTLILNYLGGFDVALKTFIIFMIFDYITGILCAIYNKKLNSKIGLKGIIKKFAYLCVIVICNQLDLLLGQTGTIRKLIIYFFVANEGLSIVENLGKMKIKLPNKLLDVLEQLKKEDV